jgi:hypothetical protein
VNWIIDGCLKVLDMDDQELESKKRFTPWIILLEILVLNFAERGSLVTFANVGGMKKWRKDACLSLMADLLRENRQELYKRVEKYCNVAPDEIRVYAHGHSDFVGSNITIFFNPLVELLSVLTKEVGHERQTSVFNDTTLKPLRAIHGSMRPLRHSLWVSFKM